MSKIWMRKDNMPRECSSMNLCLVEWYLRIRLRGQLVTALLVIWVYVCFINVFVGREGIF